MGWRGLGLLNDVLGLSFLVVMLIPLNSMGTMDVARQLLRATSVRT